MSPEIKEDSDCFLTVSFHIRLIRLCTTDIKGLLRDSYGFIVLGFPFFGGFSSFCHFLYKISVLGTASASFYVHALNSNLPCWLCGYLIIKKKIYFIRIDPLIHRIFLHCATNLKYTQHDLTLQGINAVFFSCVYLCARGVAGTSPGSRCLCWTVGALCGQSTTAVVVTEAFAVFFTNLGKEIIW